MCFLKILFRRVLMPDRDRYGACILSKPKKLGRLILKLDTCRIINAFGILLKPIVIIFDAIKDSVI